MLFNILVFFVALVTIVCCPSLLDQGHSFDITIYIIISLPFQYLPFAIVHHMIYFHYMSFVVVIYIIPPS
jgi:hypothetical protein